MTTTASTDLLADLDDEVTLDAQVTKPNSTEANDPDDLSELEELLESSMSAAAERNETKAARERLKRGGQSREQTAHDNALVKAWADLYEWQAVATAGVFNRYSCECGAVHTVFDCLMVEELHRSQKHTRRWVNPSVEHRAQPRNMPTTRSTIVREHLVGTCGQCASANSWTLEGATIWKA